MIRVIIVDDEELVRTGLTLILKPAEDLEVVAEAVDGADAVTAVLRHRPDVVLMDVRMPGMDGLSALEEITRRPDPPHVIMLTTFALDDFVHRALRAGASGFLLKDTPPRDLVNAVRLAANGSAMLAPTITKRLMTAFAERQPSKAVNARKQLEVLTAREQDVIRAVARGLSNAEIGKELAMREATVKAHVSRSLAKLGLTNRVQAAILVHDTGEEP